MLPVITTMLFFSSWTLISTTHPTWLEYSLSLKRAVTIHVPQWLNPNYFRIQFLFPDPQRMNPLCLNDPMTSPQASPSGKTTFLAPYESIQSLLSVSTLPCAPPVCVTAVGLWRWCTPSVYWDTCWERPEGQTKVCCALHFYLYWEEGHFWTVKTFLEIKMSSKHFLRVKKVYF